MPPRFSGAEHLTESSVRDQSRNATYEDVCFAEPNLVRHGKAFHVEQSSTDIGRNGSPERLPSRPKSLASELKSQPAGSPSREALKRTRGTPPPDFCSSLELFRVKHLATRALLC
jgi:hypothetical protein